MRCAVKRVLRVDDADHVDRRLQRLGEILRVRLDVELDALFSRIGSSSSIGGTRPLRRPR
jgi:hypothetical protein